MIAEGELRERLHLMFVTESAGSAEARALVASVLSGGATAVQLRWKDASTRDLVEAGRALRRATRDRGALLIVNDRLDVAMAVEADGCHLGEDDLPLEVARSIVPAGFVLGRSVDNAEQAAEAEARGASYVGLGPVFPTGTKVDVGAVVGLEGVRATRSRISIPLLAIGGIGRSTAAEVVAAGADGVAVVSALSSAPDPEKVAARLMAAVLEGLHRRRSGAV